MSTELPMAPGSTGSGVMRARPAAPRDSAIHRPHAGQPAGRSPGARAHADLDEVARRGGVGDTPTCRSTTRDPLIARCLVGSARPVPLSAGPVGSRHRLRRRGSARGGSGWGRPRDSCHRNA